MFKRVFAELLYWFVPHRRPGLVEPEFKNVLRDSHYEEVTALGKIQDCAELATLDNLIEFVLFDYVGSNPLIETLRKMVTERKVGLNDMLLVSTVKSGQLRINGYPTYIADRAPKPSADTYWIKKLATQFPVTLHYFDLFEYPWEHNRLKRIDKDNYFRYTMHLDPFTPSFSWAMPINDLIAAKPSFA